MATRYRQLQDLPPEESTASSMITFTDLLVEAVRAECGQNITFRNFTTALNGLETLKDSISIRVLHREEKPTQVGRSLVDISTKEYKNHAAEDGAKDPTDRDTTKAKVTKHSATKKGRNYQFTSTQGVTWDVGPEVGLQILAIGMGGGSIGLGESYGRDKSKSETMEDFMKESVGFEYSQEETVLVPPGKKVYMTISTYTVQYRQRYTLEFSVPKFRSVSVCYKKPCFCDLCSYNGSRHIPYSRIVRSLPNFREDNQNAYFTQEGFLTWIGESFEVDKKETSVFAS